MTTAPQAPRFTLYEHRASPFSSAVRIALHECSAPFSARAVDLSVPRSTALLKRSPFGHLPILVEHKAGGEVSVFESPAILLCLADHFPESPLGLPDITARAETTGWLSSLSAHFTVDVWRLLKEDHVLDPSERSPRQQDRARTAFVEALGILDKSLGQRPYLAGAYSVADTFATPFLDLLELLAVDLDELPRIRAWRQRLRDRPSYAAAWPGEDPDED